jgi:hypothetical protein
MNVHFSSGGLDGTGCTATSNPRTLGLTFSSRISIFHCILDCRAKSLDFQVDATEVWMTIYVRGVFRIKCAGRNNFNGNHFRSSAISDLFKSCFMLIRTYRSHRSTYRRKAAADLFLLLIWVTPPPPSYSWERPGTAIGLPASTSPLWNRKRSAIAVFGK